MPAHAKAEILAESWEPIFNGVVTEKAGIDDYVAKLAKRWPHMDMEDVDDAITEQEVEDAIKHCKRGKACGPDDLSNEWYKDHSLELVLIIKRLYNDCMGDGITPATFAEAHIFSVGKGGNASNPLNYRPIALLNTDYKFFMRILAWRVRSYLPNLVHQTHYGFVPGRTIHEAIDVYETIKQICNKSSKYKAAQVRMLDFQKAYDTLDREFLLTVLKKKGFPPKFCRIVATIHANTTVKFMANGTLSSPVRVTRGIRQGCPLAPILFIVAVDLLYDEVEMDSSLVGIDMEQSRGGWRTQVAGYADDTAIYIQHRDMQAAAIQAVVRFSGASGLMLHMQKSVAINLGQDHVIVNEKGALASHVRVTETEDEQERGMVVEAVASIRYLGHIAGVDNTIEDHGRKL